MAGSTAAWLKACSCSIQLYRQLFGCSNRIFCSCHTEHLLLVPQTYPLWFSLVHVGGLVLGVFGFRGPILRVRCPLWFFSSTFWDGRSGWWPLQGYHGFLLPYCASPGSTSLEAPGPSSSINDELNVAKCNLGKLNLEAMLSGSLWMQETCLHPLRLAGTLCDAYTQWLAPACRVKLGVAQAPRWGI